MTFTTQMHSVQKYTTHHKNLINTQQLIIYTDSDQLFETNTLSKLIIIVTIDVSKSEMLAIHLPEEDHHRGHH